MPKDKLDELEKQIGDIIDSKFDENVEKMSSRIEALEKSGDNQEEIAEIKKSIESVQELESSLTDIQADISKLRTASKDEFDAWELAGQAILKSAKDNGVRIDSAEVEADLEEQVKTGRLSTYVNDFGGYFNSPEYLNIIDSCQVEYGCIRSALTPIPTNADTVKWLEEKEDTFPSVNDPQYRDNDGCCEPTPPGHTFDGWQQLQANVDSYCKVLCFPQSIINNTAGYPIIARYAIPKLQKHFAYHEDWNGFRMLFNNANNRTYTIAGTDFDDITVEEIYKISREAGVENCGANGSLWIHCTNTKELLLEKDTTGDYIWKESMVRALFDRAGNAELNGLTSHCPILPNITESAANTKFAWYGDIADQLMMFEKGGLDFASTTLYDFPKNVLTLRACHAYGFASKGEQCSKNGVIVSTAP